MYVNRVKRMYPGIKFSTCSNNFMCKGNYITLSSVNSTLGTFKDNIKSKLVKHSLNSTARNPQAINFTTDDYKSAFKLTQLIELDFQLSLLRRAIKYSLHSISLYLLLLNYNLNSIIVVNDRI